MTEIPKTKPPKNRKAADAAKGKPQHWSLKRIGMWLTAPTALLVFFNELAAIRQYFSSSQAPPDTKMTVVVEHREPGADPAASDTLKALSVEAARFDEQDPNKLDLVCRNVASQPAFLRAVGVELVRVWRLQPVVALRGPLASSANYDLALPAASGPAKIEKELNQEIPAKSLDRFTITIGPVPSKEASARVFLFRLHLLCGAETTPAGEFLYMSAPSAGTPQPTYAANRTAVAEILKATGKKNTVLEKFLASAPAE